MHFSFVLGFPLPYSIGWYALGFLGNGEYQELVQKPKVIVIMIKWRIFMKPTVHMSTVYLVPILHGRRWYCLRLCIVTILKILKFMFYLVKIYIQRLASLSFLLARDSQTINTSVYMAFPSIESYVCRKPDSLVSFYLIYFYIYWVIFILFWFVVLKD